MAILALAWLAATLPVLPAQAAETRPVKPVQPVVESYESAGNWLKIDLYNYINPVKGQVLRFYEGLENGYEDAWAAYLIDLRTRSVKKLCAISKPFVESTPKEPTFTDFNIYSAALTPAGDKLILEYMEGPYRFGQLRKGANHTTATRMVFALSIPSGKQEELYKCALNSSAYHSYWFAWGNLCLDSRTSALWIPSFDATLNFNVSRIDLQKSSRSDHLLERPKPNAGHYGTSFSVLADGSLVYLFENEIKRVRWNEKKIEKLPMPTGSWLENVSATAEGDGLLAVTRIQEPKGESSSVLWRLDAAKGKTWSKVGELPRHQLHNYGYHYYRRLLCADQELAWVVNNRVIPNSLSWSHGGWGGYGGHDNQTKYHVLSMELKTGALKTVWRNHEVDAIFYPGLTQTQQAPKPAEPPSVKVPETTESGELSIGPSAGGAIRK